MCKLMRLGRPGGVPLFRSRAERMRPFQAGLKRIFPIRGMRLFQSSSLLSGGRLRRGRTPVWGA
ncbi:hypothetical protein MB27_38700 [Actinoplanes utahensis]|uniref:Uncharacterized protein n=1 Tax=Actinoplanes utahensis TaxID=1869 RepID=A0A0A6U8N8_ACTUT|nr:hypothetical protein MB27_38700 [Actinoplanes utahensis]